MRPPQDCFRLPLEAIEALEALVLSLHFFPADDAPMRSRSALAPIDKVAAARKAIAAYREHVENCERCEEP